MRRRLAQVLDWWDRAETATDRYRALSRLETSGYSNMTQDWRTTLLESEVPDYGPLPPPEPIPLPKLDKAIQRAKARVRAEHEAASKVDVAPVDAATAFWRAERWRRRRERAGWKPSPLSDEDFADILAVADGEGEDGAKTPVIVDDLLDLLD